jgi:type VI secretion system protein
MTIFRERFLERLIRAGQSGEEDQSCTFSEELTSIILHLQKLLNTRQGSVQISPEYGVPDMNSVHDESIAETGRRMEQVLTRVIERFEPRLSNVRIKMERKEGILLELTFKLEASLSRQPDIPVIFETVITSNGNITVH